MRYDQSVPKKSRIHHHPLLSIDVNNKRQNDNDNIIMTWSKSQNQNYLNKTDNIIMTWSKFSQISKPKLSSQNSKLPSIRTYGQTHGGTKAVIGMTNGLMDRRQPRNGGNRHAWRYHRGNSCNNRTYGQTRRYYGGKGETNGDTDRPNIENTNSNIQNRR